MHIPLFVILVFLLCVSFFHTASFLVIYISLFVMLHLSHYSCTFICNIIAYLSEYFVAQINIKWFNYC